MNGDLCNENGSEIWPVFYEGYRTYMYQNPNQEILDKCAGKTVRSIKYKDMFADEIRITFTDGSFINLIAQSVSMPEYRIDISLKTIEKEEDESSQISEGSD